MRPTLRVLLLTALFFTSCSGVVMASSTACRVAVAEQLRSARAAVHQRVHHSAATLARWKIGAAAWSKAHGGKVYAGVPATRRQDWTPVTFSCTDVALDLSRPDEAFLLEDEAPPEFAAHRDRRPTETGLDLAAAKPPIMEDMWQQAAIGPFFPGPGGGRQGFNGGESLDAPVRPASFPPAPVPPNLAAPVPAPESPTIVLLGTGMLSFLVTKLRRRTVV